MDDRIAHAAGAIADADRAVVMTGAGISTDSGIPDFRSPGGLWEEYDREDFHVKRFRLDPAGFWERWVEVAARIFPADVAPNPGHAAIADLVSAGHVEAVVTQNTDGLHQDAGTAPEAVIELHGNTGEVVCETCRLRFPAGPVRERARDGELPPRCPECSAALKPGGVLFGETLPRNALLRAHALAENADVFVVVGSSLAVEPAASLPETAVDKGATLLVNNLEPTPLAGRATYTFRDRSSAVLPRLRDELLD